MSQRAFSEKIKQCRVAEQSIDVIHNEISRFEGDREWNGSVASVQQAEEQRYYLDYQLACAQNTFQQAQQALVEQREHLQQKSIGEKLWQLSRDRAWQRYQEQVQKQEQSELDEGAIVRTYFRGSSP